MIYSVRFTLSLMVTLIAQPLYAMDQDQSSSGGIWSLIKSHPVISVSAAVGAGLLGSVLWMRRNQKREQHRQALLKKIVQTSTDKQTIQHARTQVNDSNLLQDRLFIAAQSGNTDDARLCLECGASAMDEAFLTVAIDTDRQSLIALGVKYGITATTLVHSQPLLLSALKKSAKKTVTYLLENSSADITPVMEHQEFNFNVREHALWLPVLASMGQANAVHWLLSKGVDACTRDAQGYAAIHRAAWAGRTAVLKVLLDHNAKNAVLEGPQNITPIMLAAGYGCVHATQLLLERGGLPYPSTVDRKHMSALAYAALHGQYVTTRLLVEHIKKNHGIRYITSQLFKTLTPLHCAMRNAHFPIVCYLIDQGANLSSWDMEGQTPVHIAVQQPFNAQFMEYLLSKCDDINMRNRDGLTPFDVARNGGHFQAELLLAGIGAKTADEVDAKADHEKLEDQYIKFIVTRYNGINAQPVPGYTLLDLARSRGYQDTEMVLLKAGAKTAQEIKELKELT